MEILILGGAGFVGNNLARRCLLDRRNKVTVVDSLEPKLRPTLENLKDIMHEIEFIEGDIRDKKQMEDLVKGKEVIFNCAAQSSHPLSLEDPIFDAGINCLGHLTVLEAIKNNNPGARVIFTSSSTIIGEPLPGIIDETHRELPLDIYSAHKGVGEKYHYIYAKVYGLKTISLRFANLYGPYGKGYPEFGFINYFISLALSGKPITIYGEGEQTRNAIYIGDAVDLLYQVAQDQDEIYGDIYFAVHKEQHTVKEISEEIISVFGRGRIEHIPWPEIRKRIEIGKVYFSGKKLFDKMGWEPKYNIREGLLDTKRIMEAHAKKMKNDSLSRWEEPVESSYLTPSADSRVANPEHSPLEMEFWEEGER